MRILQLTPRGDWRLMAKPGKAYPTLLVVAKCGPVNMPSFATGFALRCELLGGRTVLSLDGVRT